MDRKEIYKEKIEALFKEWREKISLLEERAAKTSSSMKSELIKDINELKERRGVVQEKWNEMQKASGDAWDSVRDRTEKAVAEMKSSVDRVMARREGRASRWFKPFSSSRSHRSPRQRQ